MVDGNLRQVTLSLTPEASKAAAKAPAAAAEEATLVQKRRLLLLVRTGLTLAVAYLLLFSSTALASDPKRLALSLIYIVSNVVIALLPVRAHASATFHAVVVLADTVIISVALYLLPETDTDLFIFYFVIILLAATSDRLLVSLIASVVVTFAYLGYLAGRHDFSTMLSQPALLLRMPFFLLAGTFYGFFADRVRRGQVAASAAGEREKAITEFVSLVTHDMKQPLWVAQQCATLLYDKLGRRAPDERPLIAQVVVNLRRMESLALNFLEFERLGTRSLRVVPRMASLNQLMTDLFTTVRPAVELKHQSVHFELDAELPMGRVDPLQIERGLANIVDNAIKYTPEGGVLFCRTALERGWITVTIGDSGPGVSPEKASLLFSRFQPGSDCGIRRSTGLGLYIAREIVRAHGGELTLDAARTPGAWFVVRLPVAAKDEQQRPAATVKAAPVMHAGPNVA